MLTKPLNIVKEWIKENPNDIYVWVKYAPHSYNSIKVSVEEATKWCDIVARDKNINGISCYFNGVETILGMMDI